MFICKCSALLKLAALQIDRNSRAAALQQHEIPTLQNVPEQTAFVLKLSSESLKSIVTEDTTQSEALPVRNA
jgi:hypothetical protein